MKTTFEILLLIITELATLRRLRIGFGVHRTHDEIQNGFDPVWMRDGIEAGQDDHMRKYFAFRHFDNEKGVPTVYIIHQAYALQEIWWRSQDQLLDGDISAVDDSEVVTTADIEARNDMAEQWEHFAIRLQSLDISDYVHRQRALYNAS